MTDCVLAIDQGTTGTTCLLIECGAKKTRLLGRGYGEVPQHFPKPGWVEHDLNEIWSSTERAIREVLRKFPRKKNSIRAIGITNQRETTGLWNHKGKPLARAIVWQDRRTAELCQELERSSFASEIKRRTGLVLDAYFSGPKIAWLLQNRPELLDKAQAGQLRFGTMDSWLVWNLTAGATHVTDPSNASRTLLFDIHRKKWDDELCQAIGAIPQSMLPDVRPSSGIVGYTKQVGFLPDGIPIAGIAGDQQAALFGQGCFSPGMAKCTYGTGAFALVNIGDRALFSQHGMLTTVAWQIGDRVTYALEGSAFVAGALVQWLRDGLGLIKKSADIEKLAKTVPDSGGVTLVPALTGLGAPYWRPQARGVLLGLTRGTTRGHIARAGLEGIALQIHALLEAMRADSQMPLSVLRVDGGASANNLLMQFQADILGVEIHRPKVLDITALGAGYLAALGSGIFNNTNEVTKSWQLDRTYKPRMNSADVAEHLQRWQLAVQKA